MNLLLAAWPVLVGAIGTLAVIIYEIVRPIIPDEANCGPHCGPSVDDKYWIHCYCSECHQQEAKL